MTRSSCHSLVFSGANLVPDSRNGLPFFPAARPDEPLGSRCTRYHIERGNEKTRETYRDLFGSSPFQISNLYIPRIEALAVRLPGDPQANVRRLVHESTLIPLVTLFTSSSISHGNSAYTRRSIGEVGVTKICVDCINEDSRAFESPHLHRSHLLSATTACWKHGSRLIDRCPVCSCPIELQRDLVLSPWNGCFCGFRFLEFPRRECHSALPVEVTLAKFVHSVLNGLPENLGAVGLAGILRDRAISLGYRWGNGKVDRRGLFAALEGHYTPAFLKTVDPACAKGKTNGWLQFLGQSEQCLEAPLTRNLLLANFLFDDGASFLDTVSRTMEERAAHVSVHVSPSRDQVFPSPDIEKCDLAQQLAQLEALAGRESLSFEDLWRKRSGAMKRIIALGGKDAITKLRSAIETCQSQPTKKRSLVLAAHPKDSKWAENLKATASRLFDDGGKPIRVTISALVKHTEYRPATWPDAAQFPFARAACESAKESQWHFYARRILWSMSRRYGKSAARTAITEDSGLEHHRANDVFHYLSTLNIVPVAPFVNQLEAKGIARDWSGPCPEKVYRKAGRGYVKTGARTAYAAPSLAGSGSFVDSSLGSP